MPQVYVHFSSLCRMLHPTDCQSVEDYPQLTFKHRSRQRKCYVCDIFGPNWVTRNDEFATENPCYFCEDCFRKLHYSPDGKKVCNFEAYPFYSGFNLWYHEEPENHTEDHFGQCCQHSFFFLQFIMKKWTTASAVTIQWQYCWFL